MVVNKGLEIDGTYISKSIGCWVDGVNMQYNTVNDAIMGELGFQHLVNNIPFPIIGWCITSLGTVVYTTDSTTAVPTTNFEIGILTTNGYFTVINSASGLDFGLNRDYPIVARESYINNLGHIVNTFSDKHTPARILEISIVFTSTSATVTLLNASNLTDTCRFPEAASTPIITTTQTDGGSVLSGTYFTIVQFETSIGVKTNWFIPSQPEYITDNLWSSGEVYDGCLTGTLTNKVVVGTINNIDTSFKFINFGIVQVIGGTSKAYIVERANVTNSSAVFIYNGTNIIDEIPITDITIKRPSWKIGTETQLFKQTYCSDLSMAQDNDHALQTIANSVVVHYTVDWMDMNTYNYKVPIRKGFQSGEVYALYLYFIKSDFTITRGYHIPGRPVINGLDRVGVTYPKTGYFYEYYSTPVGAAYPIGVPYTVETIAAHGTPTTSNMLYWENSNEKYPNITDYPSTGSIRVDAYGNQAVRHHRFPTIGTIVDYFNANPTEFPGGAPNVVNMGVNLFPQLGITTNDINMTSVDTQYIGAFIGYAIRNATNSRVIGQDISMQCGWDAVATPEGLYPSGGNWNLGVTVPPIDVYKEANYLRLHPYAMLRDKLNMPSECFVSYEYKMYTRDLGDPATPNPAGQSGGRVTGTNTEKYMFINYTESNGYGGITHITPSAFKMENIQYVPNNVNVYNYMTDVNIINKQGEEFIIAKVVSAAPHLHPVCTWDSCVIDDGQGFKMHIGEDAPTSIYLRTEAYLITLHRYLTDCYLTFTNQEIAVANAGENYIRAISPGGANLPFGRTGVTSIPGVLGGDTFVGKNCIISHGMRDRLAGYNASTDYQKGVKAIHLYNCESIFNLNMRYIDQANDNSKYVPAVGFTSNTDFVSMLEKHNWNYRYDFHQDTTYDKLNKYEALLIWNPNVSSLGDFPFRIIRSLPYSLEDQYDNAWTNFPVGDYYDHTADKGGIYILQTLADRLLIHHRNSLYTTRSRTKLADDGVDVTIKSGDIFEVDPQEQLTVQGGYGGCSSKWGNVMTKYGYMFGDITTGKVFLYNLSEGLTEISLVNKAWFEANFKVQYAPTILKDNPFYWDLPNPTKVNDHSSLVCGFDDDYDRFIISISRPYGSGVSTEISNVKTKSITISYSEGDTITVTVSSYTCASTATITCGGVTVGTIPALTSGIYTTTFNAPADGTVIILTSIANMAGTCKIFTTDQYLGKTMSYKPPVKQWLSHHKYYPRVMFNNSNGLFSSHNLPAVIGGTPSYSIWKHNWDYVARGTFYDDAYMHSWYIDVLFNQEAGVDKIFEAALFQTSAYPVGVANAATIYDKTFTKCALYNEQQCSSEIDLINPNYFINSNIRRRGGHWQFNGFRDVIIDKYAPFIDDNGKFINSNLNSLASFFEQSKILAKFAIVRLRYNNRTTVIINKVTYPVEIILNDINASARLI